MDKMKRKLPRVIYVRWDGDDEPYLLAGDDIESVASDDCETGIYELSDSVLTKQVLKKKRPGTKNWFY